MPYIGRQPPATALTSADFAAGAVGTTALANDAVTSAMIAAGLKGIKEKINI